MIAEKNNAARGARFRFLRRMGRTHKEESEQFLQAIGQTPQN
jgi:hypothetical protein